MTKEEKLEKLRDIRDTGILSVSIDGQTITYRSLAELNQAIELLERSSSIKKRAVPTMDMSGYLNSREEGFTRWSRW